MRYNDIVKRSIAFAKSCQPYPDHHNSNLRLHKIIEPLNAFKLDSYSTELGGRNVKINDRLDGLLASQCMAVRKINIPRHS